jgi:hypothetical protein
MTHGGSGTPVADSRVDRVGNEWILSRIMRPACPAGEPKPGIHNSGLGGPEDFLRRGHAGPDLLPAVLAE